MGNEASASLEDGERLNYLSLTRARDRLVHLLAYPPRAVYSPSDLGPEVFAFCGRVIIREDFRLPSCMSSPVRSNQPSDAPAMLECTWWHAPTPAELNPTSPTAKSPRASSADPPGAGADGSHTGSEELTEGASGSSVDLNGEGAPEDPFGVENLVYPDRRFRPVVVFLHCSVGSRLSAVQGPLAACLSRGMDFVAVDFSCCGLSAGEGPVTLGACEADDLRSVIAFIVRTGHAQRSSVGLWGHGLGSGAALHFLGASRRPNQHPPKQLREPEPQRTALTRPQRAFSLFNGGADRSSDGQARRRRAKTQPKAPNGAPLSPPPPRRRKSPRAAAPLSPPASPASAEEGASPSSSGDSRPRTYSFLSSMSSDQVEEEAPGEEVRGADDPNDMAENYDLRPAVGAVALDSPAASFELVVSLLLQRAAARRVVIPLRRDRPSSPPAPAGPKARGAAPPAAPPTPSEAKRLGRRAAGAAAAAASGGGGRNFWSLMGRGGVLRDFDAGLPSEADQIQVIRKYSDSDTNDEGSSNLHVGGDAATTDEEAPASPGRARRKRSSYIASLFRVGSSVGAGGEAKAPAPAPATPASASAPPRRPEGLSLDAVSTPGGGSLRSVVLYEQPHGHEFELLWRAGCAMVRADLTAALGGVDVWADAFRPSLLSRAAVAPALFGRAEQDEYLSLSHMETLLETYGGRRSMVSFRAAHAEPRPPIWLAAAADFLKDNLRAAEDLEAKGAEGVAPSSGFRVESFFWLTGGAPSPREDAKEEERPADDESDLTVSPRGLSPSPGGTPRSLASAPSDGSESEGEGGEAARSAPPRFFREKAHRYSYNQRSEAVAYYRARRSEFSVRFSRREGPLGMRLVPVGEARKWAVVIMVAGGSQAARQGVRPRDVVMKVGEITAADDFQTVVNDLQRILRDAGEVDVVFAREKGPAEPPPAPAERAPAPERPPGALPQHPALRPKRERQQRRRARRKLWANLGAPAEGPGVPDAALTELPWDAQRNPLCVALTPEQVQLALKWRSSHGVSAEADAARPFASVKGSLPLSTIVDDPDDPKPPRRAKLSPVSAASDASDASDGGDAAAAAAGAAGGAPASAPRLKLQSNADRLDAAQVAAAEKDEALAASLRAKADRAEANGKVSLALFYRRKAGWAAQFAAARREGLHAYAAVERRQAEDQERWRRRAEDLLQASSPVRGAERPKSVGRRAGQRLSAARRNTINVGAASRATPSPPGSSVRASPPSSTRASPLPAGRRARAQQMLTKTESSPELQPRDAAMRPSDEVLLRAQTLFPNEDAWDVDAALRSPRAPAHSLQEDAPPAAPAPATPPPPPALSPGASSLLRRIAANGVQQSRNARSASFEVDGRSFTSFEIDGAILVADSSDGEESPARGGAEEAAPPPPPPTTPAVNPIMAQINAITIFDILDSYWLPLYPDVDEVPPTPPPVKKKKNRTPFQSRSTSLGDA